MTAHIEKHLSHPYLWAQFVAAQLFGILFTVTDSSALLAPSSRKKREHANRGYLATNVALKVKKLRYIF